MSRCASTTSEPGHERAQLRGQRQVQVRVAAQLHADDRAVRHVPGPERDEADLERRHDEVDREPHDQPQRGRAGGPGRGSRWAAIRSPVVTASAMTSPASTLPTDRSPHRRTQTTVSQTTVGHWVRHRCRRGCRLTAAPSAVRPAHVVGHALPALAVGQHGLDVRGALGQVHRGALGVAVQRAGDHGEQQADADERGRRADHAERQADRRAGLLGASARTPCSTP